MVAYLDLIILENLCMNFIMIYTTGRLLGRKIVKSRIFIASIIGSIYVFSLYIGMPKVLLNASKVLMAVVLVRVGFSAKKIQVLIKEVIVFFLVSFMYSGCALGFIHMFKPRTIYIVNGTIIGGEYIFELLLISAIISFLVIKVSAKILRLKQKITKEDMLCTISIYNKEKSIRINALLDTGNLLTEQVTGRPVVIVEKNVAKALFESAYFEKIESLIEGGEFECNDIDDANIKIIPYMSVGNRNGIIIAYKVDKIEVEYQEKKYEITDVLIGFYNEALTKNGKYSALIGLQILERSIVTDEYNTDVKGKGKYSIC